jgi:hypothetical protein
VTVETRELRTLEDAVALLDEWQAAYRELERHCVLLDHAWRIKHRAAEFDAYELHLQLCHYWLAEATVRIANTEIVE